MLFSNVEPAECCALSIKTNVASRPGAIKPQFKLRILAVLPVAKQTATVLPTSGFPTVENVQLVVPPAAASTVQGNGPSPNPAELAVVSANAGETDQTPLRSR